MKTRISGVFLLPAVMVGFGLISAGWMTAQTFTTMHSFTGSDGANPQAGLILSGNTLYGTSGGGPYYGTVFAVSTGGAAFTNLHHFNYSDGSGPVAALILSSNTLYGTTKYGGSAGNGTVFKINIDGTGLSTLHDFTALSNSTPGIYTNNDGVYPSGGLILSGTTLYGTAYQGGISGEGTVYKLNSDGSGFTTLHSFTATSGGETSTNSDGIYPSAGLVLSGNTLYGTAIAGGGSGKGTVYKLNSDGSGFATLHSFVGDDDGANPYAGLVLSGNTLYGTTVSGGSFNEGTVFAVNVNELGFTNIHSFTLTSGPSSTNSDGVEPRTPLVLYGNVLYGTANAGGSSGRGTVFKVNINGTGFTTLHSFTATSGPYPSTNIDGAYPAAGLILSGNTLYATAYGGGNSGRGTVFSLFIPPELRISPSGSNVILRWPTNSVGFTLQCTTNLVLPTVWAAVSPGPVVVNGQNTVTNSISGTQKFYRLSQ